MSASPWLDVLSSCMAAILKRAARLDAEVEFIVRLRLIAIIPQREISIDAALSKEVPLKRVLVVDDDPSVADSLAMLLEAMGVVVRTAYSGVEGLRAIPEFKPHLAFIDRGMPGTDGYETARCIRKLADGKNLILAALNGWGRSEDRKRGAEAGLDRHYVKPIDVADIEEILVLGERG